MIINITKEQADKARESLDRGHEVAIAYLGSLKVKKFGSRFAYHNRSEKKIMIAGFKKVVFVEKK